MRAAASASTQAAAVHRRPDHRLALASPTVMHAAAAQPTGKVAGPIGLPNAKPTAAAVSVLAATIKRAVPRRRAWLAKRSTVAGESVLRIAPNYYRGVRRLTTSLQRLREEAVQCGHSAPAESLPLRIRDSCVSFVSTVDADRPASLLTVANAGHRAPSAARSERGASCPFDGAVRSRPPRRGRGSTWDAVAPD